MGQQAQFPTLKGKEGEVHFLYLFNVAMKCRSPPSFAEVLIAPSQS